MSLYDVVTEYGFAECSPMSVYGDIFRFGSGLIQKRDEESTEMLKTNPIVYMKNDNEKQGRYRILFEDEFERYLSESYTYDFAITNGLTYFGRKMTLNKASKMYALFIDFDGLTDKSFWTFLYGCYVEPTESKYGELSYLYPLPNYVVLSGHNAHLVYVFDEPISLYPNIKLQLKNFKFGLIRRVWNTWTSKIETPQYQGINQGFRPIGGKTKIAGVKVRAFATGAPKWTLEQLNNYVFEEYRIDTEQRYKPSQMSFDEASRKYPEWVAALNDEKPRGFWCVNRNLYEWAFRKVGTESTYGHRYFGLMFLAMCAAKCSFYDEKKNPNPVTFEELKRDAERLRPRLDAVGPIDYPMTDADISSALECFDTSFVLFPRETAERLTAIKMPPQKRNYRPQAEHLARARLLCDFDHPNNSWMNKQGAPTKQQQVLDFIRENPTLSNREVAKRLKISRNTVNKWRKTMQN